MRNVDVATITSLMRELKEHTKAVEMDTFKARMWSESPNIEVSVHVHHECGYCYGLLSRLHHQGLFSVQFEDLIEEEVRIPLPKDMGKGKIYTANFRGSTRPRDRD